MFAPNSSVILHFLCEVNEKEIWIIYKGNNWQGYSCMRLHECVLLMLALGFKYLHLNEDLKIQTEDNLSQVV